MYPSKAEDIAKAKKRRADLLEQFKVSGVCKRQFALKLGYSPQRMYQLLKKAEEEHTA